MDALPTLLRIGGLVHFGVLGVTACVPRMLNWRSELAVLSPFLRRLVWVYGVFISLVIAGFGTLSLLHVDVLSSGAPFARSFCAFVASFWLVRLIVQFFVFDARPLLRRRVLKYGYHGLTVVFVYLVLVYALAAVWPAQAD
jgi:hypothetical protein